MAKVDLVRNCLQGDSILLHEMGHVIERHGLEHAVQASAVSVIVALAFGGLSGLAKLVSVCRSFFCKAATRAVVNRRPIRLHLPIWANWERIPGILPV
jgi:hypothetical protein